MQERRVTIMDKIYTVEEVAEILKIPKSTAYEYVRKHVIPSFKIGKHVHIRSIDLDKSIERVMC